MMTENCDPRENVTDPVTALIDQLNNLPRSRCAHVALQPGEKIFRDLREVDTVMCEPCVTRGRRSGYCASCGVPERGAYVADLGTWLVAGHAVQAVGLLCRLCASLLPSDTVTYQLGKRGEIRVNRPGGPR